MTTRTLAALFPLLLITACGEELADDEETFSAAITQESDAVVTAQLNCGGVEEKCADECEKYNSEAQRLAECYGAGLGKLCNDLARNVAVNCVIMWSCIDPGGKHCGDP